MASQGPLRRYLALVWKVTEDGLSKLDLFVGLIFLVLPVVVVVGVVQPDTVAGGVGVLVGVVAVLVIGHQAVVCQYRAWKRTDAELRRFTDPPRIQLDLENQLRSVPSLIRLRVTNESPGRVNLQAYVDSTTGFEPGPEAPWPIPWRHRRTFAASLPGNTTELIDLARDEGDTQLFVDVLKHEGENAVLDQVPMPVARAEVCLLVHIYDADTGVRVAGGVVTIIPGGVKREMSPLVPS